MESITFFRSYYEAIKELEPEQQLEVYNALLSYALDGIEPSLSGAAKAVFMLMRPNIDTSNRKRQKNIENGANGGRPSMQIPRIGAMEETQQKPNRNPARTQTEPKENPEGEGERERDKEGDMDGEEDGERGEGVDCRRIAELYNNICTSFPRCVCLSRNQAEAICARASSGYTESDFHRLFSMAQASDFLKGRNKRHWQANFDWLIEESNMAKVLNGNYSQDFSEASKPQNQSAQTGGQSSIDMDRLHQMLHGQIGDAAP